ncbi:hypothetical protein FRB97_004787 [Tulasnella sp. 331]|nr:hypothetical protein FRB97_004787 [Tulasnella sp. 331]KAG8881449.1 hypothetical protein FRB98_004349 [Tulasnella sp. 332]
MAESLQPPSVGSAPHAGPVTLPFPSSPSPSPSSSSLTTTINTTTPPAHLRLSSTSMASVAARKAALFEKFGTGASPATPTASHSDMSPSSSGATSTNNWRMGGGTGFVKERRDSLIPGLIEQLVPAHTGSTIASTATAVESISPINPESSSPPKLGASVSRVRMAIMALNAKEQPASASPVGITPSSGRVSRSWSRMSSFTQINEGDEESNVLEAQGKWLTLEEEEHVATPSLVHSADVSSASTSVTSLDAEDESFDTHPPDMVSPRTVLAHVVHPPAPPVRKLTRPWSFTSSYTMDQPITAPNTVSPLPEPIMEDKVIEPPAATPIEETVEESLEEQTPSEALPDTPRATSFPASIQQAPRKNNTPITLRGEGRKVTFPSSPSSSTTTLRKVHNRSTSHTPSSRPSSRSLTKSISASPLPTMAIRTRSRLSSITVPLIAHEGPVTIKAQNRYPLREVKTLAPRPMRFSVAL